MNPDEQKRPNPNPDQPQVQRISPLPAPAPEPEGAGMIEALAWFEVNKKRLAVALLAAVAIGFGIYIVNYTRDQKEKTASSALVALHPPIGDTNQAPIPASAFLKVTEDYSGTAAAERALLLAAGAYFTEGKYTEAQNTFDRLIKEKPSSKWAPDATYGIAAATEAQGKRDEALTAYQRVVTTYANSAVANDARIAMARIYEAKNQPAEALKQYDELTRGGITSMAAQDAMMRRSQLLKKHPELDKPATNAVPAMMPANFPSATNRPAITTNAAPMTNRPTSATTNPAAAPAK